MKLNGTHQLLAYADDVNILGVSIHTLKENAEALLAATREIGLEVSADKTKYMSSKWRRLAHIIKKDRFKMATVVGLSTSRSEYFVRKDCI